MSINYERWKRRLDAWLFFAAFLGAAAFSVAINKSPTLGLLVGLGVLMAFEMQHRLFAARVVRSGKGSTTLQPGDGAYKDVALAVTCRAGSVASAGAVMGMCASYVLLPR